MMSSFSFSGALSSIAADGFIWLYMAVGVLVDE